MADAGEVRVSDWDKIMADAGEVRVCLPNTHARERTKAPGGGGERKAHARACTCVQGGGLCAHLRAFKEVREGRMRTRARGRARRMRARAPMRAGGGVRKVCMRVHAGKQASEGNARAQAGGRARRMCRRLCPTGCASGCLLQHPLSTSYPFRFQLLTFYPFPFQPLTCAPALHPRLPASFPAGPPALRLPAPFPAGACPPRALTRAPALCLRPPPYIQEVMSDGLRERLQQEQQAKEARKKMRQEAHLYVTLKVAMERDIHAQVGEGGQCFDLVDFDKLPDERIFRVKKNMRFPEFKDLVSGVEGRGKGGWTGIGETRRLGRRAEG
eukprot:354354-Chlamydomonas_euryale.AAC.1